MQNPIGAINVTGGSTALALSTTAALLNCWNTAAGTNKSYGANDGDPAVRPDKANNRVIVNGPGTGPATSVPTASFRYKVSLALSGIVDDTQDLIVQLRKNGVVIADCIFKQRWTVSVKNHLTAEWIIEIKPTDVPGTIATMAEPSGTFTGASGAPKTGVALDVMVSSGGGTPQLTVENGEMIVERLAI